MRCRAYGGGGMSDVTDLNLYEIAYVCGGLERVATLALIVLLQDGQIKISPNMHRVIVIRRAPRDSVESAVLDAVPEAGRFLHHTTKAVVSSPAFQDLRRSLCAARRLPRSRGSALWQWGPVLKRRKLRHRLRRREDLQHSEAGRISIKGTPGISDARIRRIFDKPKPPAPITMPRPQRSKLNNPYSNDFHDYGGGSGGDGGW